IGEFDNGAHQPILRPPATDLPRDPRFGVFMIKRPARLTVRQCPRLSLTIEVSSVVPVAIELRVMEIPNLSGLDSLAQIGLRGGVDMRPTLIRVLTDLYMQKLRPTAEEERHYTELALRLLDSVDTPTRIAVATRLARHLTPPPRVLQYLVKDFPDVAAPLRNHATLRE